VGGTLWMDGEVRGWLAGLRTSDPPLARATAEAVLVLLDEGPRPGSPLLVAAAAPRSGPTPVLTDLDEAYQRLLEALTSVRREVADVATARARIELQIGESRTRRAAQLRARLAELTAAEDKLFAYSQRMQARVEEFRIRKETLKARYAVAQAKRTINEVYLTFGEELGEPAAPFPIADDTESAVTAEAARFLGAAAELEKEVRRIRPRREPMLRTRKARYARNGPGELVAPVLLSLRPAAPGCLDVRILCAFGPPGGAAEAETGTTAGPRGRGGRGRERPADGAGPGGQWLGEDRMVLLLAVAARHARPAGEAEPVLRQAEARYWAMLAADPPPVPGRKAGPGGLAAYDRAGFAQEFLADAAAAAPAAVAAAMAARSRPYRLAELRAQAGLTQTDLARRLGVRQERVSAMERGDLTAMEARTAAAYVEALGGRLEITAEFGSDRVILG